MQDSGPKIEWQVSMGGALESTNFEVSVERLGLRIVAPGPQVRQGAVPRDPFPTELLACEPNEPSLWRTIGQRIAVTNRD